MERLGKREPGYVLFLGLNKSLLNKLSGQINLNLCILAQCCLFSQALFSLLEIVLLCDCVQSIDGACRHFDEAAQWISPQVVQKTFAQTRCCSGKGTRETIVAIYNRLFMLSAHICLVTHKFRQQRYTKLQCPALVLEGHQLAWLFYLCLSSNIIFLQKPANNPLIQISKYKTILSHPDIMQCCMCLLQHNTSAGKIRPRTDFFGLCSVTHITIKFTKPSKIWRSYYICCS